ncbi:hypothetical protein J7M23_08645, partial [Candidatus Sumerlaeota bacterium]|nr:hypothetical protein [Candidatus Sumerlaeota bacterium]
GKSGKGGKMDAEKRGGGGSKVTLPLNLKNGLGVGGREMHIELSYDTNLLTPCGVYKTVMTSEWSFSDNHTTASGVLIIDGETFSTTTLVGEGNILNIEFLVDSSAQEAETALIEFQHVDMYTATGIPLLVDYLDNSVFTVAQDFTKGDLNGDGTVSIEDAIIAQEIICGLYTPTPVQVLAGDLNGNGMVDAGDVTLIMQMIGDKGMSPVCTGLQGKSIKKKAGNYRVSIPWRTAQDGEVIYVPVNIETATGVAGGDFLISYDSSVLTLKDVMLGNVTSSGFSLKYKQSEGYQSYRSLIKVTLSGEFALDGVSGSLFVLEFQANEVEPYYSWLRLAEVKLRDVFGEDLSWENEITKTNGKVIISTGPHTRIIDWWMY